MAGATALIRDLAAGIIASLVFALVLENLAIGLLTRTTRWPAIPSAELAG
ncbi:MAG: hypothetical protein WCF36_00770 [Candidatus Nanopelagicales bacterium]